MKHLGFIAGILTSLSITASATTRYVWQNSPSPTPPYISWATAATNIQDAIDVAVDGDLVLVTNGVYATGGKAVFGTMTNRVAVTKRVTVQSVNGLEFTIIQGQPVATTNGNGAIRCVYLTNGASLSGFTLTNGGTLSSGDPFFARSGGGVYCESASAQLIDCMIVSNVAESGGGVHSGTVNNCVLSNNSAISQSGAFGGGADQSTLNYCTITGNSASTSGGGAYLSTLNYCTITGNSSGFSGGGVLSCTVNNCVLVSNVCAHYGGGANLSTLNNCLLRGNYSTNSGGFGPGAGAAQGCNLTNCTVIENSAGLSSFGGIIGGDAENCIVYFNTGYNSSGTYMNNCCTTPLSVGSGNFTNAPLFVNQTGGNLRLQTNSPCIDAGNNSYVSDKPDLDGRPRIVGDTVDMGAYELQGPGMSEFIGWLQQHKLPTDGSADFTDNDTDSHNNWQEWKADTIPTNSQSVLRMTSISNGLSGILVQWQSTNSRTYFLERTANLPSFSNLASNIVGLMGTTAYTDTTATNGGSFFFRVGVQE